MKKMLKNGIVGIFFCFSIGTVFAQTTVPIAPEIQKTVEMVTAECKLKENQVKRFTTDYTSFLTESSKLNANTQMLLFRLGTKLRTYFSAEQYNQVTKMYQEGRLTSKKSTITPAIQTPVTTTPAPTTSVSTPSPTANVAPPKKETPITISTPTPVSTPSVVAPVTMVTPKSNAVVIFEQFKTSLQVTSEKAQAVLPILKEYDANVDAIKLKNTSNPAKIQPEIDALNTQTVPKLLPHINNLQLGTLVLGMKMHENIITGKDLTPEQKALSDKLKTQYGLNEAQITAVALVLVQAKIRGDIIQQVAKVNPQTAQQEGLKLIQDLDTQLKSNLTGDQYTKIKADIEKALLQQK